MAKLPIGRLAIGRHTYSNNLVPSLTSIHLSAYIVLVPMRKHKIAMPASGPLPHSSTCPFCAIASSHPPFPPSRLPIEPVGSVNTKVYDPPPTHIILSTKHVLAFLDIMPLTRGHVLVISRGHYERLGQVGVGVGREVCLSLFIVDYIFQIAFAPLSSALLVGGSLCFPGEAWWSM